MNPLERLAIHGFGLPPMRFDTPWAALAPPFLEPEILRVPILLEAGQVLENRCFVLAPDFAGTTHMAAIYAGGGAADIVIRNVVLLGSPTWLPRWNSWTDPHTTPGICTGVGGIRLQVCPRVRIEDVRIEGFPRCGIEGHGLDDAIIRDVAIRHCFQGLHFGNPAPSSRVQVSRLLVRDTWGPDFGLWPGIGGAPSADRPGEFIGSDGLVAEKLRDSKLVDVTVLGEAFVAMKLAFGCQRVEILRLRGNCLQLDGSNEPTIDCVARDCELSKELVYGSVSQSGQALQVSNQVQHLRIDSCRFKASPGHGGHGAQVYGAGSTATITRSRFEGFNGLAGTAPAYALQTAAGGSVNADFESANRFVDQQRVWLRS